MSESGLESVYVAPFDRWYLFESYKKIYIGIVQLDEYMEAKIAGEKLVLF